MTAVGQRLRTRRREAGLTQGDLAGAELSTSYISLIESGRRTASLEVMELLARRLGCPVAELLPAAPAGEVASPGGHPRVPEAGGAVALSDAGAQQELAYVRFALEHGEPASVLGRLDPLLAPRSSRQVRHEATMLLAEAQHRLGDAVAAVRTLQPVLEACLGRRSHLAPAAVGIAAVQHRITAGDPAAAVRVGERVVEASRAAGQARTEEHLRLEATVMLAHYEHGDLALAASRGREIIAAARALGSDPGVAAALWNWALVAEARGDLPAALDAVERAYALLAPQGSSRNLLRLQITIAWYLLSASPQRAGEAGELLDAALTDLNDLGSAVEHGLWESSRALAHLLLGEAPAAEVLARRAVLHLRAVGETVGEVQALLTLADALVALARREEGAGQYRTALRTLAAARASRKVAALYRTLAHRLGLLGDTAASLAALGGALDAASIRARPGPVPTAGR